MNLTSANMAFMSWSEITGMHFISWNKEKLGLHVETRANSRPWLTPGSSESPSLCRWECLSHKGACYLDCLSLKIIIVKECTEMLGRYTLLYSRQETYQVGGLTCCKRPWRSVRRRWGTSRRCSPCPGRTRSSGSWSDSPRTCKKWHSSTQVVRRKVETFHSDLKRHGSLLRTLRLAKAIGVNHYH